MKDSFQFTRTYFEAMQGLTAEEKGLCLDALANYILNDIEPEGMVPPVRLFFTLVKPHKSVAKEKEKFSKPTIEEIEAYCQERKNGIAAESFYNFYESKGWKVGNTPMKDWKACVRTWENKNKQDDWGWL